MRDEIVVRWKGSERVEHDRSKNGRGLATIARLDSRRLLFPLGVPHCGALSKVAPSKIQNISVVVKRVVVWQGID